MLCRLIFKGQIFLESFTLFGNIVAFAQKNFEISSVHLIDNVRITSGPVNVSQVADNQLISVYPNPTEDVVWFENVSNDLSEFDIEIFNSLGAKISEIRSVSEITKWDSKDHSTGVYFLQNQQIGSTSRYREIDFEKMKLDK